MVALAPSSPYLQAAQSIAQTYTGNFLCNGDFRSDAFLTQLFFTQLWYASCPTLPSNPVPAT
jgi:hypothetical protein